MSKVIGDGIEEIKLFGPCSEGSEVYVWFLIPNEMTELKSGTQQTLAAMTWYASHLRASDKAGQTLAMQRGRINSLPSGPFRSTLLKLDNAVKELEAKDSRILQLIEEFYSLENRVKQCPCRMCVKNGAYSQGPSAKDFSTAGKSSSEISKAAEEALKDTKPGTLRPPNLSQKRRSEGRSLSQTTTEAKARSEGGSHRRNSLISDMEDATRGKHDS